MRWNTVQSTQAKINSNVPAKGTHRKYLMLCRFGNIIFRSTNEYLQSNESNNRRMLTFQFRIEQSRPPFHSCGDILGIVCGAICTTLPFDTVSLFMMTWHRQWTSFAMHTADSSGSPVRRRYERRTMLKGTLYDENQQHNIPFSKAHPAM